MRHFFQFRLRTMLAFMALCSFGCAWVGANFREWQAEQQALAALGPVAIDHQSSPVSLPIFL